MATGDSVVVFTSLGTSIIVQRECRRRLYGCSRRVKGRWSFGADYKSYSSSSGSNSNVRPIKPFSVCRFMKYAQKNDKTPHFLPLGSSFPTPACESLWLWDQVQTLALAGLFLAALSSGKRCYYYLICTHDIVTRWIKSGRRRSHTKNSAPHWMVAN